MIRNLRLVDFVEETDIAEDVDVDSEAEVVDDKIGAATTGTTMGPEIHLAPQTPVLIFRVPTFDFR